MLWVCCGYTLVFWFLIFTVCYHDYKSILSIAFNFEKIIFFTCSKIHFSILFEYGGVVFWSFWVFLYASNSKSLLSIAFNYENYEYSWKKNIFCICSKIHFSFVFEYWGVCILVFLIMILGYCYILCTCTGT